MTIYTVTKTFIKYDAPECEVLGVYNRPDRAQKCLERIFARDLNRFFKNKPKPECLISTWLDRFYGEILVQNHGSVKKPLSTSKVVRNEIRYYIDKTIVK